ncbi:MAG: hypothetical protein HUJ25_03295 [Crocinitomicaceae bacterium]|nr:hypothetical protein [Crocinitomicaceae bacterium]
MRFIAGVLSISLLFSACDQQADDLNSQDNSSSDQTQKGGSNFGTQNFIWEFKGEFTADEKEMLKEWITEVGAATIETLGQYPFDVLVVFHASESKSDNEPVIFGHTDRGPQETVHFYVDPDYPLDKFLQGWTAPHEIAHLSLPFVGRHSRWFSEGYATYLSRRTMINMGYYSEAEFDSLYRSKIHQAMAYFSSTTSTHLEVADSLMENHDYGSMYWGSSSFFMTADSLLQQEHHMRFEDVVMEYQSCCRLKDKSLLEVIKSYDKIIGDTLFSNLMYRYRNLPSNEVMKGY